LRVIDHARRCVAAYRQAGRVEPEVISMVNLGDGLWGAGRVTESLRILHEAHEYAQQASLRHAEDIAHLCLANVLAASARHADASQLYERGIDLAVAIGHDWDELYGASYYLLSKAETGKPIDIDDFFRYAERASACHYHYLESLALSHAGIAAFVLNPDSVGSVLEAIRNKAIADLLPGPSVHVHALNVLHTEQGALTKDIGREFFHALGRCQGLKGRPRLAIEAIRRLRSAGLVDLVQAEFANRWSARFGSDYRDSAADVDGTRLRACDYRACEARCCYDGVYLEGDDEVRIRDALSRFPQVFADLPAEPVVSGRWHGMSGPKTAVRPHRYSSPDFPEHFTQTRCVFAAEDGACRLQLVAEETGEDPWAYKPRSCWTHPLAIHEGEAQAPPQRDERDPQYVGVDYPGYVTYTPCGQDRNDGKPWRVALSAEIRRSHERGYVK
jgi:hypothetical protein